MKYVIIFVSIYAVSFFLPLFVDYDVFVFMPSQDLMSKYVYWKSSVQQSLAVMPFMMLLFPIYISMSKSRKHVEISNFKLILGFLLSAGCFVFLYFGIDWASDGRTPGLVGSLFHDNIFTSFIAILFIGWSFLFMPMVSIVLLISKIKNLKA